MTSENQTILQKISAAEDAIKSTYIRIDKLEEKLNDKTLTDKKKDLVRRELEEVRKLLATYDDQLNHLRSHNRNTFVFVALLFFVCCAMYTIYVLVRGHPVAVDKILDF